MIDDELINYGIIVSIYKVWDWKNQDDYATLCHAMSL